jgi:hypothetical protein
MKLEEIFRKKISQGRELLRKHKNPILERDPQAQMVMRALALLASNQEYELHNRIDRYTESFLDNYGMEFGRHPSLVLAKTSGLQSRKIAAGTLIYAQGFLRAKYDHQHHNLTIDQIRSAGDLAIKIELNGQKKIEKLRIHCPPEVISNIFGNKSSCEALLEDDGEKISCKLHVDNYTWSDILYAPDFFSSFSVEFGNLEFKTDSILLSIPLRKSANYPPEDFALNRLVLENSFIYPSDEIFIHGPGKYAVSFEKNLKFLSGKGLTLEGKKLKNIREDPEGWYITRQGGNLFLNIQKNLQGACILESIVSNLELNPENSYFQEANNCTIKLLSGKRDPLFFTKAQIGPLINSLRMEKLTPENLQRILGLYPEFCHWNLDFSRQYKLYPGKISGITVPRVREQIIISSNNSHCNLQLSIKNRLIDNHEIIWRANR